MPRSENIDLSKDRLIPLVGDSPESVCSITGKKPETVLRWAKGRTKRVLEAWKIGGSWYTTHRALEAFVVSPSNNHTPKPSDRHLIAMASLNARLARNGTANKQGKNLANRG